MNIVIKPKELFNDIDLYIILSEDENNMIKWEIAENTDELYYFIPDRNVWPPLEGYNPVNIMAEKEIFLIRSFTSIPDIKEAIKKRLHDRKNEEVYNIYNDTPDDDVFW